MEPAAAGKGSSADGQAAGGAQEAGTPQRWEEAKTFYDSLTPTKKPKPDVSPSSWDFPSVPVKFRDLCTFLGTCMGASTIYVPNSCTFANWKSGLRSGFLVATRISGTWPSTLGRVFRNCNHSSTHVTGLGDRIRGAPSGATFEAGFAGRDRLPL